MIPLLLSTHRRNSRATSGQQFVKRRRTDDVQVATLVYELISMELRQALQSSRLSQILPSPSSIDRASMTLLCVRRHLLSRSEQLDTLRRLSSVVLSRKHLASANFSTSFPRSAATAAAAEAPPPEEEEVIQPDAPRTASPNLDREPFPPRPRPSVTFPGQAARARKSPVPTAWADKLASRMVKAVPPGAPLSAKPNPGASGNPADFLRLMQSDVYQKVTDISKQIGDGNSTTDKLLLNRTTGRSVRVTEGMSLPQALERLQVQMRLNRVQAEVRRQRFHERPGLKRKRLKSERWRRNFKGGFIAAIQRATDLHRQGW
jgi:small subunit ribosomal protein MRP21